MRVVAHRLRVVGSLLHAGLRVVEEKVKSERSQQRIARIADTGKGRRSQVPLDILLWTYQISKHASSLEPRTLPFNIAGRAAVGNIQALFSINYTTTVVLRELVTRGEHSRLRAKHKSAIELGHWLTCWS